LRQRVAKAEKNYLNCELLWQSDQWEITMIDKLFHLIAGTIFALVALLQALRIYMGWPVVIGGWSAPMWVSWIAIVVAGSLSYFALTLKSNR
jgi:hypothetical protein